MPLTMRDYLTPDARETWTFRLTDAQGNPMQGNMVLNMTDKALEPIQSSLWQNPYMLKWEEPFTAFRKPSYYPRSHNYLSHVPSIGKGVYFLSPVLFEPYRVDSAQLMVVIGKVVDVRGEPVVGAVISEWLGGFSGLGVYMTRVRKSFAYDRMFAVIILISVLSLALMRLVDEVWRMIWRHSVK